MKSVDWWPTVAACGRLWASFSSLKTCRTCPTPQKHRHEGIQGRGEGEDREGEEEEENGWQLGWRLSRTPEISGAHQRREPHAKYLKNHRQALNTIF
jgi:hypothetical protein